MDASGRLIKRHAVIDHFNSLFFQICDINDHDTLGPYTTGGPLQTLPDNVSIIYHFFDQHK